MKKSQSDERELSDLEIWNLFRSGDESAFEFIYQKYFDKLYNYGCQFTMDHAMVEDVLQELFIELKRRSKHLSATDKIQPYLFSAFRRKIIRSRNKRGSFRELDLQQSFSIVANAEELIIEDEIRRENLLRLQNAMETLSERYREIIFLFYYENLTYEEIREIQGFENIKSARNLLYKALKSLQKKIKVLALFIGTWYIFTQEIQFVKKISEL